MNKQLFVCFEYHCVLLHTYISTMGKKRQRNYEKPSRKRRRLNIESKPKSSSLSDKETSLVTIDEKSASVAPDHESSSSHVDGDSSEFHTPEQFEWDFKFDPKKAAKHQIKQFWASHRDCDDTTVIIWIIDSTCDCKVSKVTIRLYLSECTKEERDRKKFVKSKQSPISARRTLKKKGATVGQALRDLTTSAIRNVLNRASACVSLPDVPSKLGDAMMAVSGMKTYLQDITSNKTDEAMLQKRTIIAAVSATEKNKDLSASNSVRATENALGVRTQNVTEAYSMRNKYDIDHMKENPQQRLINVSRKRLGTLYVKINLQM